MKQHGNRLMSIGEIAKSLEITRKMILNYEDKGLVTPDIKEGDSGNRYYTADTLTRIRTIRVLQNLGLSLDEIRAYFDGATDMKPLIERLEHLRDELDLNIEKLKERMKTGTDTVFKTVTVPAQTVYCRTFRAVTVRDKIEHLRDIIPAAMREYGSDTSKRMYFIEYPLTDTGLISYCVAVPTGSKGPYIHVLSDEKSLCVFHHGSYEQIPDTVKKLVTYAHENGIEIKGFCRHIYLEGPPQHSDPAKYITQLVLPIADMK